MTIASYVHLMLASLLAGKIPSQLSTCMKGNFIVQAGELVWSTNRDRSYFIRLVEVAARRRAK